MRFGAAWSGFVPMLDQWVKMNEGRGPAAVQRAYLDTLNNILHMSDGTQVDTITGLKITV